MAEDSTNLKWLQTAANELNNLLQVIVESETVLETFCRGNTEAEKYLAILRESTERAAATTQSITLRIGGHEASGGIPPETTALQPAQAKVSPPEPQKGAPPEIYNPDGTLELILIVDDEEYITMLAQRVLASAGYRVVTARSGPKALDLYRKFREEIALVILDFTMPVMDGADVFAELQDLNPKVPVVLSSGFAEQDKLRIMLARGLRGFIPKPYTREKLLAQVRHTLDAIKVERTAPAA